MLNRRNLLLTGAALGLAKSAWAADMQVPASKNKGVIQPISPFTGMEDVGGDYAKFVVPGLAGLPTNSFKINLKKELQILCWFPKDVKTARPLIFSHGELSEPTAYRKLLSHWASHGFLVIAPVHDDSLIEEGLRTRRTSDGQLQWDINGLLNDSEEWFHRVNDCRYILDNLDKVARISEFNLLTERPIIAGHSFGAYTAELMMGAQAKTSAGKVIQLKDDRLAAAILLSPPGSGIMGLEESSWKEIERALLVITGQGDTDSTKQTFKQKEDAFNLSAPNYKHLAEFNRIYPNSYSGANYTSNTDEERRFFDLTAITTAFLKAYGDYDQEVLTNLAGNYYHQATKGRVNIYYR